MCECLEMALLQHIRFAQLPQPVREYPFSQPRKHRFDFAWPERRLAAECEGATGIGRHTHRVGYENDCEKYNIAVLLGWRVLRFTKDMIESGKALGVLEEAMREQPAKPRPVQPVKS